jgi:alpha-1,2-mannosyltransferase
VEHHRLQRIGYALLLAIGPMLAALWAGATTIPGGVFEPWDPAMIDLDVYRRTGQLLISGGDIYNVPGQLPWIYPPFAALLTIPWALVGLTAAEVLWLAMNTAAVMAMLFRLGLTGWQLSLASTAAIWLVEPVRETLGFGQLGILLVTAAVLDSMPGPRVFQRRLLPEGWLTGLATAVKLTPAVVAMYNFFAGKRREGIISFIAFLIATLLAFALLPGQSWLFWTRLIAGDSGINSGILFKTNQSVMGVWSRLFGEASRGGLIVSALVLVIGVAAAVLMHRLGEVALAVCLAGITSLLASPISWSHHYVWILPLGVLLLRRTTLPLPLRLTGLFYAIWTAYAPFKQLPGGDKVELTYGPFSQLVDNVGVVAGVAFLVLGATLGWRAPRKGAVSVS